MRRILLAVRPGEEERSFGFFALFTEGFLLAQEEQQLPVLLVDGYNVLHRRWQERRPEEAVRPICLEDEREALINDTRDYALSLRCRPIVVFDAMANRNVLATPRRVCAPSLFSCLALRIA